MSTGRPFRVVSIHGAPRSGTSWLGQVFDSAPEVAYRHQPLFAYRFKDRLRPDSTRADVERFLRELYEVTDDDFLLDASRRAKAPAFWDRAEKSPRPGVLVMKMVRYHHLLPLLLDSASDLRVVALVRHPCAVIHSWLNAPKEFRDGWSAADEWRLAPSKNLGRPEEFNGFERWKELASAFLELERREPERVRITRYEDLVGAPREEIARVFEFAGLDVGRQTLEFLRLSHGTHDADPYSVLKDPSLHGRWESELDPAIADEIVAETTGTPLARFLA